MLRTFGVWDTFGKRFVASKKLKFLKLVDLTITESKDKSIKEKYC